MVTVAVLYGMQGGAEQLSADPPETPREDAR
jgi:hypothetical protein